MLEFLFKKRLQDRCFPVNIAKFVRTPILKNSCQRLLLIGKKIFIAKTVDYLVVTLGI